MARRTSWMTDAEASGVGTYQRYSERNTSLPSENCGRYTARHVWAVPSNRSGSSRSTCRRISQVPAFSFRVVDQLHYQLYARLTRYHQYRGSRRAEAATSMRHGRDKSVAASPRPALITAQEADLAFMLMSGPRLLPAPVIDLPPRGDGEYIRRLLDPRGPNQFPTLDPNQQANQLPNRRRRLDDVVGRR